MITLQQKKNSDISCILAVIIFIPREDDPLLFILNNSRVANNGVK